VTPLRSGSLVTTLSANALLRIAGSASGVLIGLYLAELEAVTGSHGAGTAGTLGAVAFAAELLFSIPLGMLSDVVSPRWVMVAGALLGAIAVQLFGMTHHVSVFYGSRLLEGIGAAAITPPLLAYLAENTQHDAGQRARLMSLFELTLLVGLALGGVVATQFWHRFSKRAFSLVAAAYLLAAVLLAISVTSGDKHPSHAAFAGLRRAFQDASVRRLAPVWLCVNAVTGLWLGPTLSFLLTERNAQSSSHPQYLDGIYAADPTHLGWALLLYAILFAAGVTGWSILLPRMQVRTAMLISLATMLPVCLGFYLVNHYGNVSGTLRWSITLATAGLILIESGFTPAALSWLAGSLEKGSGKGSAMGIYSVLLSVGAIAGSMLAGALGKLFRFDGLLLGTALLAVCGLILLTRLGAAPQAPARAAW
jgi:MFS family permease